MVISLLCNLEQIERICGVGKSMLPSILYYWHYAKKRRNFLFPHCYGTTPTQIATLKNKFCPHFVLEFQMNVIFKTPPLSPQDTSRIPILLVVLFISSAHAAALANTSSIVKDSQNVAQKLPSSAGDANTIKNTVTKKLSVVQDWSLVCEELCG